MTELYAPVYDLIFCEFPALLHSTSELLSEVASRTELHNETEVISVSEAGFVRENVGMIELTKHTRLVRVVCTQPSYLH